MKRNKGKLKRDRGSQRHYEAKMESKKYNETITVYSFFSALKKLNNDEIINIH